MAEPKIERSLIRKVEAEEEFPLSSLAAIRELRSKLDAVEDDALCRARDLGASITEIAETMGRTRQAVYNRLKQLAERQAAEEADLPDIEDRTAEEG